MVCIQLNAHKDTVREGKDKMTESVICWVSDSWQAYLHSVTYIPTVLPLGITAVGWVTQAEFVGFYGIFLTVMYVILTWIGAYQMGHNMGRDPLCPEHLLATRPALPVFYSVSVAVLVLIYSVYRWRWPGYLVVLLVSGGLVGVPLVQVLVGFSSPEDVWLAAGLGVGSTWLFFFGFVTYLQPVMSDLIKQPPICWMGYQVLFDPTPLSSRDSHFLPTVPHQLIRASTSQTKHCPSKR